MLEEQTEMCLLVIISEISCTLFILRGFPLFEIGLLSTQGIAFY